MPGQQRLPLRGGCAGPKQDRPGNLEDIQGELEARAKFIAAPLDRMVDHKEINAYEIIVLDGHEKTFLEDETMRVKIRYLSRGYIREIEIDLGRAPANA